MIQRQTTTSSIPAVSQIKQAILHPEAEVRHLALRYFTDSFSSDTAIMPLVIQAVGQYGMGTAFGLLRAAEHLPQSPTTIEWLMQQLRRAYDAKDLSQENNHYAVAMILLNANPDLLVKQHREIVSLMPDILKERLDEQLKMHFWSWDQCWEALLELGRSTMEQETILFEHDAKAHRILKALASHGNGQHDFILNLLRRQYKRDIRPLMEWIEPWLVELAGRMRIEKAIPLLIKRLNDDFDDVTDQIGTALVRIGTESVIQAVNRVWHAASVDNKYSLGEPLDRIHCELAVERSLTFLHREPDFDIQLCLGRSMLCHFDERGIEPVRQLVVGDEDEIDNEQLDLRYVLVAAATVMGKTFPEYEQWHQEAINANYGWQESYWSRLSLGLQGIFEDIDRPEVTTTTYQLKVALKGIKPPIWRRLIVRDCSLTDLHQIIQVAMGWDGYHHFAFRVGGVEYGEPDPDGFETDMDDAGLVVLSEVIEREKQKFTYHYDFGDDWQHEILVEKVSHDEADGQYPMCLDGRRACPPEDVGGVWGYEGYLAAVTDPDHGQHEEMLDWGGEFDPEAFDLETVNKRLAGLRRPISH